MTDKTKQIIQAWRDPEFRASLSPTDQAGLPSNPAGLVELNDQDLGAAIGGTSSDPCGVTSVITAVSAIACDSILHGSCSSFSIGCCC